jgi:hypothetical protein
VSRPAWSVPTEDIQQVLSITRAEIGAVGNLLQDQGLLQSCPVGSIGLSQSGQIEAERLGVLVPMTDPPAPSSINIHANYSVVQIAGLNSNQSGSVVADRLDVQQILSQIERELPSLNLEPAAREEAAGLIASLKSQLTDLPAAAGRAIAGALSSLLTAGGSDLGHALMKHFGIQ